MARQAIVAVRKIGSSALDPAGPLEWGIEAAAQTYSRGAILINNGGSLQEAGANPTTILGVAVSAATGVTGTKVGFIPATSRQVFEASFDDAADLGNGILAQSDMWDDFGVTLNSGVWYVDRAKAAANQVLRVIGAQVDVVLGTTKQARCYVVFTSKIGATVW